MIELIILMADLVYYYGIYLLYSQTATNDFTLTIAIGIVCLVVGIFFSAIPSSMKGVGILSISEWYVGINMLIKESMFVSIFLSVAFAFSYERELLLLLMVIGICITLKVIAMIHKQDINIQQYIETLNNSDTSQYKGMFSYIVGNFIVLTLLMNFHESTVEMIIAWVCVIIYNIIFSYRISKRIAKKWIVILVMIEIVTAVTAFIGWNLLTWMLFGDYVAVFKHSLKRGIIDVDIYDRIGE